MPYVTSAVRLERIDTLREDIVDVLEIRFGEIPSALREHLNTLDEADRLKALHRLAVTCTDLAEFERALAQ